jgi:hypothetical protein
MHQPVSSAASSTPKNLNRGPLQLDDLVPNVTPQSDKMPSPVIPIPSKLRAWKEVGKLIPLGKNRKIPSESNPTVQFDTQATAQAQTQHQSASGNVEDLGLVPHLSPLSLGDDDDISAGVHMDMDIDPTPDPIGFMQSVVQEIPLCVRRAVPNMALTFYQTSI